MERSFGELLRALREAVRRGHDITAIEDDLDHLAEFEPEASRVQALAYTGDESGRLWGLGKIGDPRDLEVFVAALDDPALRMTAFEGLGQQPDRVRVDAVVRPYLHDGDPRTRARAVGLVSWCRQPGALQALTPLAGDENAGVRRSLGICLERLGAEAEPLLLVLMEDPDPGVRASASLGMRRLRAGRGRGPAQPDTRQ
ncbi:HEAT repeat domain-containing protein [Actinoplanes flavus]|uniref:HEAT repeat domain-containing protein n=1 Tax=Actinoplanes flavus TaxID=2820290 RepID=A0ABS3UT76_9ACTN|nr:HEAT repeat domain-containing protein [Actinoplanes flavus]MBO3741774.1 HEAT repeat domain-containing protein [Actinoplanes flavus]